MKKVLITLGTLAILTLGGIWVYLMFFNTNAAPGVEILADLSRSTETPISFDLSEFESESGDEELSLSIEQPVVQLTNRPVAGSVLIGNASSTKRVRFMERGTGHTYEVNLESGRAQRISGTTIPRAVEAVWAESGNRVAVRVEVSSIESQWLVGALVRDAEGTIFLRQESLPTDVDNVAFDSVGDTVFFTFSDEEGSIGYAHDLKTKEEAMLWSVPLSNITVLWGEKTYVYPKPTAQWDGYLYEVSNAGSLTRIERGAKGLTAKASPTHILINQTSDENDIASFVINTETGEQNSIALGGLPEKCAFGRTNGSRLWCSVPLNYPSADYPDAWYRGDVVLSDFLWEVDTQNGEATLLVDFEEEIFRSIDANTLSVSEDERYVLIENKYNNTLWLVDLTL